MSLLTVLLDIELRNSNLVKTFFIIHVIHIYFEKINVFLTVEHKNVVNYFDVKDVRADKKVITYFIFK